MKVYIVVPVFGRLNLTKNFFNSLKCEIGDFIFIVIDDDPVNLENYKYFSALNDKNVVPLRTSGDMWWCGTTSVGVDYVLKNASENDIMVIANNDVILSKGSWDVMLREIHGDRILHPETISNGRHVSSGAKIISWFPFVTRHPLKVSQLEMIDLCTARFLCMQVKVLFKIGNISKNLLQYQGDNDLSLRAKRFGVNTFIVPGAACNLFDEDGKSISKKKIVDFLKSFFNVKSPNNIKYRYRFVRNHFNQFYSFFIVFSMTINSFVKYAVSRFSDDS